MLAMLADTNYHLTVLSGEAEYTDPKGNRQTIDPDSPPLLIQGFDHIPIWRIDEPERHPATP